jgi:hypothetical protein
LTIACLVVALVSHLVLHLLVVSELARTSTLLIKYFLWQSSTHLILLVLTCAHAAHMVLLGAAGRVAKIVYESATY